MQWMADNILYVLVIGTVIVCIVTLIVWAVRGRHGRGREAEPDGEVDAVGTLREPG